MILCTPSCGMNPETTSGGERYEVELLSRLPWPDVCQEIILARGKSYPDTLHTRARISRFPIGRGLRWWMALFVVPQALKLARPFDLLRVHSLKGMGPACLIARKLYGWSTPIVAHHHHLEGDGPWPIERMVVRSVDRVIVGSEYARRQLAENGFRTDHVRVVPYGIDGRFRPRTLPVPHDDVRVLFLGGLKPRKNLQLLRDVWRALERPKATLLIVGEGPERAMLERAGIPCLGYAEEKDKAGWYQTADIFVSPSLREGFGLTVGEAMSSGLSVVTSNAGALPELVADAGMICRTKEDYVRALRVLIDEPKVRHCFGSAGRERIDRFFRWDRCVEGTMRVYREML